MAMLAAHGMGWINRVKWQLVVNYTLRLKKWISKNRWAHIQKVLLHHLRDPIVGAEKHESNRT
jgi:hypothetical protein